MSFLTGKDFQNSNSTLQLPDINTNGSRSAFEGYTGATGAKPAANADRSAWRHRLRRHSRKASPQEMETVMQQIGGDGYLFAESITRQSISEITDGLVPALRRDVCLRG